MYKNFENESPENWYINYGYRSVNINKLSAVLDFVELDLLQKGIFDTTKENWSY